MAGVKGRSGRYKSLPENLVNECGNLAVNVVMRAIRDESISLLDRAKIATPLVARRIADKVELVSYSIALPVETVERMIELYKANLLLRQNLQIEQAEQNGQTNLQTSDNIESGKVESGGSPPGS